jgi:guanylate kinase
MAGRLQFSISATTRSPRPNETGGVDYYFISRDEFLGKIKNDEFVEWAEVYGNYYGTLKSEITKIIEEGKNCLLDVDVQGGMNIKKAMPESILIFILPPSLKELKRRIMDRKTDDKKTINLRLRTAVKEMGYLKSYQYSILNDDIEKAYLELKALILKIIS